MTSQYNGYIHDRVVAVRPPASVAAQLTPAVKGQIVRGIQQAGTIAGSLGLKGDPSHPNPYANSPLAPLLAAIARASFVDSTITIIRIAVVVLVIGTLAALVLVKRSDLRGDPQSYQ